MGAFFHRGFAENEYCGCWKMGFSPCITGFMKCYETLIQMRELYAFVDHQIIGDFSGGEFGRLFTEAKNSMDEEIRIAVEDQ